VRRAAGLIAATLLAGAGLAACGGGSAGLIPTNNVTAIGNDLSSLSAALSAHSCSDTQGALGSLLGDIDNLPSSVAAKLKSNLVDGYERLDNTARVQCKATVTRHTHTGPTGPTQTTTSPTGPTQTTTSPTGPTQTTTSPTGPTQTTTSPTGPSVGPGGGSQAPPGSSGDTGTGGGTGGAVSAG
jgi:hypothetical protein